MSKIEGRMESSGVDFMYCFSHKLTSFFRVQIIHYTHCILPYYNDTTGSRVLQFEMHI